MTVAIPCEVAGLVANKAPTSVAMVAVALDMPNSIAAEAARPAPEAWRSIACSTRRVSLQGGNLFGQKCNLLS